MALKIAVANQKGGIGKTTTALALANGLSKRGKKVLLIDTDPQRNSSKVFQAETENVATLYDIFNASYKAEDCIQHTEMGDVIASDILLQDADTQVKQTPKMYLYIKRALKNIEDKYDFIIFDTPPKTGVLLGNVLMATQYVICPITCDMFGFQGILDFYNTVVEYLGEDGNEELSILGILRIKYKGKQNLTRDISENVLPEYAEQMNTRVFETTIRESVKCQEAQTLMTSLFDYAPNCTSAIDYNNLITEILGMLTEEE